MTHALLLTDVVDSTRLSEQLGDARMAELWAAHDRVARDLLRVHHGREIDKTDGFLLLFEAASDAVAYAVAYHRALRSLDLKARAGLHVGPVILTENAPSDVALGAKPLEVDGIAKPTAARVMSIAVGGQTLLTPEALAALGHTGLRVESHGHWRMKGVSEPIELFEIGDEDAPFVPPPDGPKVYRVVRDGSLWLPIKQIKYSLPRERDAFVGRDADLQDLARRLDARAALVSVLGIGGTGKTRLVTRYAWTWLGDWPGGVWFCDLSEARGVDGIAYAVARALDVPLRNDPIVQLGHAIAGRGRCLIILDNFEQVARYADETLGRWLDWACDAQFVVTTREVLGLPGETALALAPLQETDAVGLFAARAAQAKRGFALTEGDRPHVETLVALLDRLPLAIELAAARVRVMPPKVLVARMGERFKLLTSSGGRRDRQATLQATLDWSWDLLSADEQQALAQVSVFEGGFTLEAVEAVLSLDESWPMDAVQALVDKSLVRAVSDERFDLLVSVQEYAAERLEALGGRLEAEVRHGEHYASHGTDEALEALTAHGGVERWWALATELDNLMAVSRRAMRRGDGELAAAAARVAWTVLVRRGPFAVAVELATEALRLPELTPRARGVLSWVAGNALVCAGQGPEAGAHYEQALAAAREVGDRRLEGVALQYMGALHFEQGRMEEARAQYEQALTAHRETGDRRNEGVMLCNLGILYGQQGQMDEAQAHLEQALAVARKVGHRRHEGNVLGNLGILHAELGRMDEARAHYEQALAVLREVGDRGGEGNVLGNLGILHRDQGRMDEAGTHYEQALAAFREVGNRGSEGWVLGCLGNLQLHRGRMDEARAHYEQALAVARKVGDRGSEGSVLGDLGILHADQGRMDEARSCFDAGIAVLRAMHNPLALSNLLCGRALLRHATGRRDEAREDLAEAEALAAHIGAGPDSELGQEIAKARAALEAE